LFCFALFCHVLFCLDLSNPVWSWVFTQEEPKPQEEISLNSEEVNMQDEDAAKDGRRLALSYLALP
jgi:hypothetical protein